MFNELQEKYNNLKYLYLYPVKQLQMFENPINFLLKKLVLNTQSMSVASTTNLAIAWLTAQKTVKVRWVFLMAIYFPLVILIFSSGFISQEAKDRCTGVPECEDDSNSLILWGTKLQVNSWRVTCTRREDSCCRGLGSLSQQ